MKRCLILLLLCCLSGATSAEPAMAEIDVHDLCRNWSTFPTEQWVNTTGRVVQITDVTMAFVSAQSLIGEFGMWIERVGRSARLYSFGVEVYEPPTQPLARTIIAPADARYTLLPGEAIQTMINCGPVSIPGWQGFWYFGVLQFHYQ